MYVKRVVVFSIGTGRRDGEGCCDGGAAENNDEVVG